MDTLAVLMGSVVILAIVAVFAAPVFLTFWGLYLAFKANIILGVISLLLHPLPFILGMLALFGKKTVAAQIATWIGLTVRG